jgi:hypothetical protein
VRDASVSNDLRGPAGRRLGRLAEGVVVLLLVIELVAQLSAYPSTADPDPDGFVSYARHLREHQSLIEHSERLPGYPLFLALVWDLWSAPLAYNVWWAQGTMMVVLAVVGWALTRRWLGPLPAIILLGILAAPCFLTRMSVEMLADMLYAVLALPLLLTIVWWALRPASRRSWLWCIPFALGLFVTQSIRPTTFLLGLMLGPAIVVGYVVARWWQQQTGDLTLRLVLTRTAVIVALAFVSFFAGDRLLDRGAREYNTMVVAYRVIIALPPADDTPADNRIERAKERLEQVEGQPIDTTHFLTYRHFVAWQEIRSEDALAVWQGRLLRWPGLYLFSIWQDLRLNHFFLTSRFTPLFFPLHRTGLFGEQFLPYDGSLSSKLFYATGIVLYLPPEPPPALFYAELGPAVARIVAVWGFLLLGCWQLARRYCAQTVAFVVLFLGFALSVSATNTIDGRYLLPFAMLIYLAEAMGIAWIAQSLLRTGSAPPTPAPPGETEHRKPAAAR